MSQGTKRRKLSNGDYEQTEPQPLADISKDTHPPANASKPDQRRSLFVRSLPASVTTEVLTGHFSQSFPLKHATIVIDPKTKVSRGFGFVTFTDAEDAQAAVEQFNNSVLEGRKIKVEIAESRHREIAEDVAGVRKETKNLKAEELRQQRQQATEENRPPKLIVRNLPWSVKTSDDLAKLFLSYGKVKHASVPKAKSGLQAGFGFVILRGKKNAEKALEGVNGKEIDGRTLAVDWAVDKEVWEKLQKEEAATTDSEQVKPPTAAEEDGDGGGAALEDTSSEGESDANAEELEEDDDQLNEEEEAIMNGEEIPDVSESEESKPDENSTTVFIRNLPFTADDDSLKAHFREHFGAVRYARVVYDNDTERSRGTAFVCFFNEADAKKCVKDAPKREPAAANFLGKTGMAQSVLQSETADPSGHYTMEGRVLQVSRALNKADADRRMHESSVKRDHDKRRLYLLSEGTIARGSQLYNSLGKTEIDIRESSAKQRQKLIKTNPNLGLSLSRLSIRNIPRSVTTKDLKALARQAVVGFAKDMREGKRQQLSREELTRGGEVDREAEKERKTKGKGIVKQVKIVFESENTGSKVGEGKGGRSRGYGFIEYYGHRNALMGLRWLNGHLIKAPGTEGERGKRLIVEFAIENAQVLQRRQERERRFKEGGLKRNEDDADTKFGNKRKRDGADDTFGKKFNPQNARRGQVEGKAPAPAPAPAPLNEEEKNKLAMRNRIIAEKRMKRRTRKGKA